MIVIDMNDSKIRTLDQIRQSLDSTRNVHFAVAGDDESRFEHIFDVVRRFGYRRRARPDKGLVLRSLQWTYGSARRKCETPGEARAGRPGAMQGLPGPSARLRAPLH